MNEYADLHIHTCYSDGAWTPKQVMEEASKRRLRTISVADHDTFSGSVIAWKLSKEYPVDVILGIEFSCVYESEDVHLLGYFLRNVAAEMEPFLKELQQRRKERAKKIIDCFEDLDIDMSEMDLDSYGDSIGRPHFAKELLRLGVVKTFEEAFEKYLRPGRPCYVEKAKVPVQECIEMIRRYGGVSILAHPGFLKKRETLYELLKFKPDGLEVYHTKHNQKDKIDLYNTAKKYGLLISGGSDFHENTKSSHMGIGSEKIPVRYVEAIKEKIHEREKNI